MSDYHVHTSYEAAYPDPIVLTRGDRVPFERRPSEWEGWLWCRDRAGKEGWVPEAWASVEGDTCVLKRDYTAAELSVVNGDVVAAITEVGGWVWCRSAAGREGWLPLDHLERV